MSEELQDEVEAINSIYGEDSLVPAGGGGGGEAEDPEETSSPLYILRLPDETVSLRLQFPAAYPAVAPTVVSTNSAGGRGRRGEAARDLALFRRALAAVYRPGQVCLFDAVEELKRLQEEEAAAAGGGGGGSSPPPPSLEEDAAAAAGEGAEEDGKEEGIPSTKAAAAAAAAATKTTDVLDGPEPPWVLSSPVTEMRSTFLARCAPVSSPGQAAGYVRHLLASDKRARSATHNITAWRVRGPGNVSYQDCDDDGETAAGGRLLHLMQLMDLWDAMVVVTRWYGGQKLGPRRFALINAAARDAFVKAGLVGETQTQTPAAKKKGGHGR